MQQAQDLDGLTLDPENRDKWRFRDHQLTGSRLATRATGDRRCSRQCVHLLLYLFILADRGQWVLLRDKVQLLEAVGAGPWEPFNGAQTTAWACLSQAARRLALLALTASLETHFVAGSSASLMACSTSALNHLS